MRKRHSESKPLALIEDPAFPADAERQHLDINQPMTGAEIDTLIAGLYATPKAVVEKAVAITDMTTFK